jgi:hypothetical protein
MSQKREVVVTTRVEGENLPNRAIIWMTMATIQSLQEGCQPACLSPDEVQDN